MNRRSSRLVLAALVLAGGGWVAFLAAKPPTPAEHVTRAPREPLQMVSAVARVRTAAAVALAAASVERAPEEPAFSRAEAQRILTDHLEVATRSGDADEMNEAYGVSITILRAYAKEVVPLLRDQLLKEENLETKTLLVETLGDLESPHAFEPLGEVALSPVPPDPDPEDHLSTALAEERVLRSSAVDGLAQLAAHGHEGARQLLYKIASDPGYERHGAIRTAAILGFVGTGPGAAERAEALRDHIPAKRAWALQPRGRPDRASLASLTQAMTAGIEAVTNDKRPED